ncbi:MAG: magnesium/cobalt transporter CorA [Candidatus Cloacimonetes bacterium]|nr:magnesium/cobalt transporter CorA [Candidatus Cloacimonadota bacterium]
MPKIVKRSVKAGLPPGTLIHIGEQKVTDIKITSIHYNNSQVSKEEIKEFSSDLIRKDDFVQWINIDGLHNVDLLKQIGTTCDLHILTLEDILNTEQRPKIEDYGNYYFIVIKMLSYNKETHEIEQEQVSVIVKDNLVVTFQEREGDVFDPIRERVNTVDSRIRRNGVDFLLYALIDAIVDNYFIILERIGDEIEDIEETILSNPSDEVMRNLYMLKRNVVLMRKNIWPMREVIGFLERTDVRLVKEGNKVYFRDLYDHTIQVIDNIESLRDLIAGMVDIYLSTISNRMNSVMKVLTIIATIFIPLTFIAGVYGMNFVNMPELEWKLGYPLVIAIMIGIGLVMLHIFRRKKWL